MKSGDMILITRTVKTGVADSIEFEKTEEVELLELTEESVVVRIPSTGRVYTFPKSVIVE